MVLGGGFWVTVIMVEIMVDFSVFWVVIFKFGYSGWLMGLGLSVVVLVGGGRLAVSGLVWYGSVEQKINRFCPIKHYPKLSQNWKKKDNNSKEHWST
nr:hypothetical protein CFP56_44803 [Quercus suber]